MNEDLKKILNKSTFTLIDGVYIYTKVKSIPNGGNHFMMAKDKDEITIVTKLDNQKYLDLIERNKDDYNLISLNVTIPFYSIGFLATISNAIANQGMNILIISTYSKDYIMTNIKKYNECRNVLLKLGLKEIN